LAGAKVHASAIKAFFIPSTRYYKSGGTIAAPYYLETADGKPAANITSKYRFKDSYFDNDVQKNFNFSEKSGEITTDAEGRGTVVLNIPDSYATVAAKLNNYYSINGALTLSTTDDRGNRSDIQKPYSLSSQNRQITSRYSYDVDSTYLSVVSDKNAYVTGDTITVSVTSPAVVYALVTMDRGRVYKPHIVKLDAGANTLKFPVEEFMSPSVTVNFSYFAAGQYHNEGISLNIPAMHRVLSVEVLPDKSSYKPSEKARIKIRVKDAQGNRVKAKVSLAVIDKAILTLRQEFLRPLHSSFYYYRNDDTNSSSSLTMIGQFDYGGGRGGGGGAGGLGNAADQIAWHPELTTNEIGEAEVEVDLKNFTTTWKAAAYATTDKTEVGQGEADFLVTE
jgi:uncharacterized protein YfaS (alpha-2-macroglobulin family)